ncbi:MAG: HAMP domain-containing sensor histidine kinase [Chitinophagaceae bacterium]
MKPLLPNRFSLKLFLLLTAALLFTFSFIFNQLYTSRSAAAQEARHAGRYLQRQQTDFNRFLADTQLVRQLVTHSEAGSTFDAIVGKSYGIFLYRVSADGVLSMNFWNNQQILPPPKTYPLRDMEEFMQLSNGYYLVVKKTLHLSFATVVAYAMIPVQSAFYLETEDMPQRFIHDVTAGERVAISDGPTDFAVTSLSGKTLFYLEPTVTGAVPYNSWLTILLRFSGLLFLFFFIHLVAESLARRRIWKGVLFLSMSLLVLRLLMYIFPALFNFRQFELFDPSVYGSNIVQRSLGDLLINSIFFCWIILFTWYKVYRLENKVQLPLRARWITGIVSLCLLIYSTFILSSVIRSMIADSKISFDVTDFFSLDKHTLAGFIVLAMLSLSYYYFTQLLFRIIFPLFRGNTWAVYFVIAFSGLVFLTIRSGDPTVLFYIPVLAWLLIYTWLIHREGLILHRIRINIAGILFWIFVFSVSIAAIMLVENKRAEWNKRKFYAEKLAIQTDPSSESTLSIALKYLDNDFLQANFYRFADSFRSRELRDSIITGSYNVYLANYDTRLYVYTAAGTPLFNDDATSYDALNTIVTMQSQRTGIPDVFSYETSSEKYTYITRRIVKDTAHNTIGYFFVVSNPKKFRSDELFPELFRQFRKNDLDNSLIYYYAVYMNGKLVRFSDRYPFATVLDRATARGNTEFENRTNGDYNELWYRAGNEKMVVIVRKRDTLIETITLFSYIFCSFLFLVFIVQLLSLLLKAIYDRRAFYRFFHFNIRNQVHSTIIFISIFCFIIIGVATISFFKSRFARSNNDKLSRTMQIMVNEMQKRNAGIYVYNSILNPYGGDQDDNDLYALVKEMSDIHGVDVNVYDLGGNLLASSATNVYTRGVLSNKMDPVAFYHLSRLKQVSHIQNEKIADFSYTSIYAPVRDNNNNQLAYLSIPYFTSETELDQEISNFIVTIINLNAFVFLVAGLIALFITNRITRSFSIMSSKMKEVNLGKMNEEIVWSKDDEIGDLVKEYNKMVAKLGESAQVLARTEREGAWREMARQVAHEIKNPLTPMKLGIQYLQKAIDSDHPNVKDLSANVARTLVEQIDHLSKIAADFSQFANIGNISVEEFDLHEVLHSLQELYRPDPRIGFEWQPLAGQVMVRVDRTQMNRLFTNLFANAIEACSHDRCRIVVSEEMGEGTVRISVNDNGDGIAPQMQSRIFTPNFTTKSSGTGLGLAMCKSIVEQAGGRIWFETVQGSGTTFYVELPVIMNDPS